MPTTYAHYRFGSEVRSRMQGGKRDLIERYLQLYDIGVHGPDILFYYKPYHMNPVMETGLQVHEQPGWAFFHQASRLIRRCFDPEPYLVYLFGMQCHFALDAACHGYINRYVEEKGVSHHLIEAEFDRVLLEKDGKDPLTHTRAAHITPSVGNAEIISRFYPGISWREVQMALRAQIFVTENVLRSGDRRRRFILNGFRLFGQQAQTGLVMNRKADPACRESNVHLIKLYKRALPMAQKMIETWDSYPDCPADVRDFYQYNFVSVR